MAKALEKLTEEMKVFLGSLLYGIVEDKKIREPNRSSFENILSGIEARGYDVLDYRNAVKNCSNFKNLIKTESADIRLKTNKLVSRVIKMFNNLEAYCLGYKGAGAGTQE